MIIRMNHITLAVKDIDKSFAFYPDFLGFKPLVKWNKGAYFLVGDFWFCLNVDDKREPNAYYTHYAFTVTKENFDAMSQNIIASGAQVLKDNTSPGESLYFLDPDGHKLEIHNFLDPDGHKLEIHMDNWKTRIDAKKVDIGAWNDVEWFV